MPAGERQPVLRVPGEAQVMYAEAISHRTNTQFGKSLSAYSEWRPSRADNRPTDKPTGSLSWQEAGTPRDEQRFGDVVEPRIAGGETNIDTVTPI